MAYDEVLAERIRHVLEGEPGLTERKMFGGLGFMLEGRMAVAAASRGSLMVRVAPEDAQTWIAEPGVEPMEMRGRELRGWLLVEQSALTDDDLLERWVARGTAHVRALPTG